MPGVQVTVRLSGRMAERLGNRRIVTLAAGAVVEDLVSEIAREAGFDPESTRGLAVVSAGAYVSRGRPLADGEELDVLVPVAGG
jgi:molybdopterin converting factor small subunit